VVEILTALVILLVYRQYGFTVDFVVFSIFLCLVIVITFIDLDHQIIPNRLLLIGLIPGFYPLIRDGWVGSTRYLTGAVALGFSFYMIALFGRLVFKKESMGMGDIKYAALIGLLLGWRGGLIATFLAFLSAALLFLVLVPFGKVKFGQRIPFGPFLSLGTFLSLLWGPDLLKWYLHQVF
jgi:leader peptidase (prepilin peptidase)/N-methyltransferase